MSSQPKTMSIEILPAEMLIKIFQMLEPRNIRATSLVCKHWNDIMDFSALWSWCKLKLYDIGDLVKLEMRRAQYIEEICLEECDTYDLHQILKSIESLPKIKIIWGLAHKNLSYIESNLLSRVINKVEEIDWCFHTRMTSTQAQLIIEEMANKTKIKELQMVNKYLLDIQADALGSAVNNVEAVYMSDTNHGHIFSPAQVSGISNAMSKGTNMKNLMLRDIDISQVEPTIMALAISKLKELMIWKSFRPPIQSDLSEPQCKALFSALSKKTNLKRLVMTTEHLKQVEPTIFAKALNHLEEVSVYDRVTDLQAQLFFSIMAEKTSIQKFRIFNNNLSTIRSQIMAKGIIHLEELIMVGCSLTSEQTLSIFLSIKEGNKLKKLNLSHSNLSSIDKELLTTVINQIEQVSINNNSLTSEQIISLLKPCAQHESKLRKLTLRNTKLTDIDPKLLSEALKTLKKIEMNNCSLRPSQVNMILEENLAEDSNLEDLSIINEDLDQVELGLLEEAANIFNVSYAV